MPDLRGRFESLSRMSAPDLWPDIEGREPRAARDPVMSRRVLAAVVAFAVAVAGIGFAALTFVGSQLRITTGTSGTSGAKANGSIYLRVGGADGGSRIESIEPDGTGRHVVFPEDSPVHYSRIAFSPDGTRILNYEGTLTHVSLA
jgi:hypothetical protein